MRNFARKLPEKNWNFISTSVHVLFNEIVDISNYSKYRYEINWQVFALQILI